MLYKTFGIALTALAISGTALAQADSCPALVRTALEVASEACAGIGRNQVCYGNIRLEGEPKEDIEEFALDAPGDIVDAADLQALHLSALDADADTWGIALMNLQGNIPATLPGQNVTFLLFGDVEITDAMAEVNEPPLQAFYFKSGLNDAPCPEAPDSGILIQTPEGVQRVEFRINEVTISVGSTIYVQAQPSGDMTLSVVEGEVEVEAAGTTVTVPAGSQTSVPLDADLNADGAPSEPEAFDPADLAALPVTLLPRAITINPEATPEAPSGDAIIPAAGTWEWVSGAVTSENCPEGVADVIASGLEPKTALTLPGDAFNLDIFFLTAFGTDSSSLPNPILSNADANTYIADFSDPSGYNGNYTVTVLSESEISGQVFIDTGAECTITMPFTVTLIG